MRPGWRSLRVLGGVLLGSGLLAPGATSGAAFPPSAPAVFQPVLASPDTLRPDTLTLDTLPVLGSRVSADMPLRTRSVELITRQQLERLPARSVSDALSWAAGVDLMPRSPAQADLSLRGAGFEQVLVLVDGVRMSDPQTGHFDLDLTVPLDRVERIEILKGPASALYGSDAVGGVVNVVTRSEPVWSGRLEGGSFGTSAVAGQGSLALPGNLRLHASGERSESDGHREGTDWETRMADAGLRAPVAGGTLSGEVGWARRAFGADGFYADFPSFETTRTRTATLRWRSDPGARVRVEPRVSWRRHEDDFILVRDDPELYRNRHASTQYGGELVVRARAHPRVSVAAGAEAYRHELASNALGGRSESRRAVFAEAAGLLPHEAELTVGLRHDDHDRWGGFTSPSLAASWAPTRGVRLRGSAGRSFRGPSWTERHYEDPAHQAEPELRPERSRSLEAGVRVDRIRDVGFDLTAFHRRSLDLIDWARPRGSDQETLWVTRNVIRATTRGLEVTGDWSPGLRTRVEVGGSVLSSAARGDEGFESKYALRPITDEVRLGVVRELPGLLSASIRVTRARRVGEASHLRLDARLEVPFMQGAVYLDGRNLSDSDHLDITGHPVAGRALYLGFRVGG